ncbi:MAG TPA: pyridoxamine 5'-phosphate oxidase family protein [Nitrososphaeraceae archaeon]|jgi:nitroimidazol reductase NimA-like FMN-containing flavoprotein (pyridoxamine 5'-phosphate oxidase superfamily)|nr:pyridoxamine 5'-phosphate oxidase family protein [Nitrososphaeraceae archaeon]
MKFFSQKETKFIIDNEICRIATAKNNIPHVIPVCYSYNNGDIFFATDYTTQTFHNLKENNRISLIIDIYDKKEGNKGIYINGIATIIDSGKEFVNLLKIFYNKFEWVKKDPWSEKEAPFIQIQPTKKISWGI